MAGHKLRVLHALDVAQTQWYHFTAIIIAGMGFFTDAYYLFCISLVTELLGRITTMSTSSLSPGRPSLCFYCRQWCYPSAGHSLVSCSLAGSGTSSGEEGLRVDFDPHGCLLSGVGSFVLGTVLSRRWRPSASSVLASGFGILAGSVFAIIISSAFQARFPVPAYQVDPIGSTIPEAANVWRIILMVGALAAALTYYWRIKMPETARFTALVTKIAEQAASDMSSLASGHRGRDPEVQKLAQDKKNSFGLFSSELVKRHGLHLLGTTSTWFLLDIALYSQNLFQKDTIGWIPAAKTMNAIEEVFRIAHAQTLIALCSTVPGYWFTVALIDRMGRSPSSSWVSSS
ncbi:hypothetical protein MLD38_025049 [Melastoma candidum]|uniref:Uncharacterized protein n=1 Tax=Melastoma candidum TaxID=119954 RepID=A0ACB9NZA9_9MYRT|nr:hypothetical protein MLD38_025049 [Melastoma candidum]